MLKSLKLKYISISSAHVVHFSQIRAKEVKEAVLCKALSWNILSRKGLTRIIVFNPWVCTGHPQEFHDVPESVVQMEHKEQKSMLWNNCIGKAQQWGQAIHWDTAVEYICSSSPLLPGNGDGGWD